jgi:hypothetical protein
MKNLLHCFVLLGMFAAATAFAGQKYAVATGTWDATSTWSLTRGGASGATAPTATDTVYIPAPYMVTYLTSAKSCYNLIVESGAAIFSAVRNPTNSQVYIRVTGDSVVNNGIIGYDPALGPDSTSALCFEAYASGKKVTFTGTGKSRISRIRGGNNLSNTGIVVDQDMTLTYTGSSGTGGVAWYGNQGSGSGGKLTINAGHTLTLVDQGYIGTASSAEADATGAETIQVDGTLLMNGPNSTMSLRPGIGQPVSLIVNGTVEIGRTLKPTSTTASGSLASTITVNAGGILKVGTAGLGVAYFNTPAQTVTGAGTFQFAGGTMQIGAAAGLDSANGPIRTVKRIFAAAASYTYVSSGSQATGKDLPQNVYNFTVADTGGTLTLTKSLSVDSALTLNYGKLAPGTNTLTVRGLAVTTAAGTFVDGNMIVPVTAIGAKTWTVGEGADALPLSAYINSVTGGDNVTVAAVNRTITAPAGGLTSLTKVLNRYYRITKGALLTAVKADSLVLSYSHADAAAQNAREDSLRAFMYTGSAWSPMAIVRRDSAMNTLITAGVAALGDIIITGADMTTAPILTIKAARAAGAGATVNFEGIATRVKGNYVYMQDTTAGIVLYNSSGAFKDSVISGGVKAGDKIRVQGKVSIYNSLYEIVAADLIGFQVSSRGNALPAPVLLTLKDISTNGSVYQSQIVRVLGVSITSTDAIFLPAKTYQITDKTDNSNAIALRIGNATDTDADSLVMLKVVTFTGPLGQFNSSDPTKGFQLMPVLKTDITDNALSVEALHTGLPSSFELGNNYPNPFNPATQIRFALPQAAMAKLAVYDMLGREVCLLVNGMVNAGYFVSTWNGKDNDGLQLSSGMYIYRMEAGSFVSSKKMLLLK